MAGPPYKGNRPPFVLFEPRRHDFGIALRAFWAYPRDLLHALALPAGDGAWAGAWGWRHGNGLCLGEFD